MPPKTPAAPIEPSDAFTNFKPDTTLWNAYNAKALVYASDLAYSSDSAVIKASADSWGFDKVTIINPGSSVLQAVIMGSETAVVVAFRGTRPSDLSDWMTDFEIVQTPFSKYFTSPNVGGVHDGFARLLAGGWKNILAEVTRMQAGGGKTLWITGHSLGGALAVLATAAFTFSARLPVNGLYTYGQPRVGDISFCTQCDSHFSDFMFRFVNNNDIVTRIPPRIVPKLPLPEFYGHSGQLRFFDQAGKLYSDEHYWNAFLLNVEVGFSQMQGLLSSPIADHKLLEGYATKIEAYIDAGLPPLG